MGERRNAHLAAIVELVVNVAAPTIVLTWFSDEAHLGSVGGLLLALAFPLGHALVTVAVARRVSPIAALVIGSVALTGGIGLLELDVGWFAWKEAALPLLLGALAILSLRTRWPLLPTVLDPLLDSDRVARLLAERGETEAHARALVASTWRMGVVLVLTAVGTFLFARYMVTSPTGTEAFSAELGRYTGWSFPAVGIPSTLLMVWVLSGVLGGLERRTGLGVDDLLR